MVDVKGIVAVLVVLGSFGLMLVPIIRGEVPTTPEVGFASGGLMLVLGFYFGHVNGAATALANNATALASQAIAAAAQRRTTDPPVVTAPVTVVGPNPPIGGPA